MSTIDPGNLERANARTKSYTTHAVATLILYFALWLPGLIANVIFLLDARRMQRIAGQGLPGVGCLWLLLTLQVVVIILLCAPIFLGLTVFRGI